MQNTKVRKEFLPDFFVRLRATWASTVLARGDAYGATAIIESPKDLR